MGAVASGTTCINIVESHFVVCVVIVVYVVQVVELFGDALIIVDFVIFYDDCAVLTKC